MSDNLPTPASAPGVPAATNTGALKSTSGAFVSAAAYSAQFTVLVAKLAASSLALRGVGSRVRATYRYIGDCARTVDHLANLAAALRVDADTIGEHRDAAKVMRGALARAQRMANAVDELAVLLAQAAAAHRAEYEGVNDVATSMSVPMANRNFYRNNR